MKKLNGMKKDSSSLENKRLKDLKTIQGGSYNVKSNVPVGEGCEEYDTYTGPNGTYIGRITVCNPTQSLN